MKHIHFHQNAIKMRINENSFNRQPNLLCNNGLDDTYKSASSWSLRLHRLHPLRLRNAIFQTSFNSLSFERIQFSLNVSNSKDR